MADPVALFGVILAAGGSTRMGQPKAWLDLDGTPLISAHIQALAQRCTEVIVVLGDPTMNPSEPQCATVVWNPDWASTTPADSLRCALARLPKTAAVLVTPVDAPPAPTHVLDALLDHPAPAVPTHAGQWGHPVLVPVEPTHALLSQQHLRSILEAQPTTEVPVEWADTLRNLNTPEEWRTWRAQD